MTASAENAPTRRFLITVAKPWKLWIWPVLGLLYFAWVLLVVTVPLRTGVPDDLWVLGGLGLFVFLVLVELLLLPTRRVRVRKAKRGEAAPVEALDAALDESVFEPPAEAPSALAGPDAELLLTNEDLKGRRVVEVSLPPKSQNRGAVYAKAYVAVDASYVLRVEDLVAGRDETG